MHYHSCLITAFISFLNLFFRCKWSSSAIHPRLVAVSSTSSATFPWEGTVILLVVSSGDCENGLSRLSCVYLMPSFYGAASSFCGIFFFVFKTFFLQIFDFLLFLLFCRNWASNGVGSCDILVESCFESFDWW